MKFDARKPLAPVIAIVELASRLIEGITNSEILLMSVLTTSELRIR